MEQNHSFLQEKGWHILNAIAQKIAPGLNEVEATLMANDFLKTEGIAQIWHPTIIKFDFSTLVPGVGPKPSAQSVLRHIAIVDLGIVMDGVEVDCGLTLGFDSETRQLAQTAKILCAETIQAILNSSPRLTPAQAFAWLENAAREKGVQQIASVAGHRLGAYPTPKKETKIRASETQKEWEKGGWMLEVHVSNGTYGAFYEDFFEIKP